jgi:hypothetical protein
VTESVLWSLSLFFSAAAGFALKSLWNYAVKRQAEVDKQTLSKRLEFLQAQLSSFYWPLYIRLHKDNVVWERILGIQSEDKTSLRYRLGSQFEKAVGIPNHVECVSIIESKVHLAQANEEFMTLLLSYIAHVALYKALREAGEASVFPFELQCRYPVELFSMVREKTLALQENYDRLIRLSQQQIVKRPISEQRDPT